MCLRFARGRGCDEAVGKTLTDFLIDDPCKYVNKEKLVTVHMGVLGEVFIGENITTTVHSVLHAH
jgi:hypothetical protein